MSVYHAGTLQSALLLCHGIRSNNVVLARDAFVRTNRRAIAMMFVSPSVWDGRAL